MKQFSTLFLLSLMLYTVPSVFAQPQPYEVGEHVDNFTLIEAYGDTISLYDYSDRIVCMPFWNYE
ncbi:MAG: hypothetical protein H8E87_05305 [FCB group bacterium]|nr:hypothetical protein [FCB group bacterium]